MTGNREDYIKVIYELGGEKQRIGTKSIARSLNISLPSVSEMIKKLVKEDYVEYQLYKGVKLTEKGREKAVSIKKRHLLWEVFLVEKLGYSWEDVHEEAEILEHVTSPKLEKSLEKYLDYPKVCPHGTPLQGNSYIQNNRSLDSMKLGESITIERIVDEKEILRYIKSIDLNIGDTIKLVEKDLDGKLKIEKNGRTIDIEDNLAKKIYTIKA